MILIRLILLVAGQPVFSRDSFVQDHQDPPSSGGISCPWWQTATLHHPSGVFVWSQAKETGWHRWGLFLHNFDRPISASAAAATATFGCHGGREQLPTRCLGYVEVSGWRQRMFTSSQHYYYHFTEPTGAIHSFSRELRRAYTQIYQQLLKLWRLLQFY